MKRKLLLSLMIIVFGISGFFIPSAYSTVEEVSTDNLFNYYEIATGGTNLDGAVDDAGNVFVVYERSGNIYIVKNRESEELVGVGTRPALALGDDGAPH